VQLTVEEQQLCERLGFPAEVGQALKTISGHSIEQAQSADNEGELEPARGLSSIVSGDLLDCVLLVERLKKELPAGFLAFYSTALSASSELGQLDGMVQDDPQELVVLPQGDWRDIVAFRATGRGDEGPTNGEVKAQIEKWKAQFGFEILGASSDYVALEFHTLPSNLCAFAEEVYRFCPDAVEQGVGLMEEEDDPEFFAEARALCPAISTELREFLEAELQNSKEDDETEEELAEVLQEIEMGIRLLANQSLFLWWD
jgi:hypothetical protein